MADVGRQIHDFCAELFPICRSITGDGVRQTLRLIQRRLPELQIHEAPTGTRCFDWTVPNEWNIRDAYILGPDGAKIVDFKRSNLHVVGYSVPVDATMSLEELQPHLFSLPDQPDAIPYVTSYYKERWGFCISENQRRGLGPGPYRVVIDSTLSPGSLTYGELLLPGLRSDEVFLSTYICHPSLANNELSGPAVTAFLASMLMARADRRYTYRIVFIPETIGSILYLSRHLEEMKRHIIAGFNITCVGDERAYSYLPSRSGRSLADRVAVHVLKHTHPDFVRYSFLDRGSDERQYCSPGVDLPVASVMRTKYGVYPEYHTSLDNLDLITPAGLGGAYAALAQCIEVIERNETLLGTVLCEPQLGKRGLYPDLSTKDTKRVVQDMMDLLAYCDGATSLLDIAELIGVPVWQLYPIVEQFKREGLLEAADAQAEAAQQMR